MFINRFFFPLITLIQKNQICFCVWWKQHDIFSVQNDLFMSKQQRGFRDLDQMPNTSETTTILLLEHRETRWNSTSKLPSVNWSPSCTWSIIKIIKSKLYLLTKMFSNTAASTDERVRHFILHSPIKSGCSVYANTLLCKLCEWGFSSPNFRHLQSWHLHLSLFEPNKLFEPSIWATLNSKESNR